MMHSAPKRMKGARTEGNRMRCAIAEPAAALRLPEDEISHTARRKGDAWKRKGRRVTLLRLLVLWRCHAERSWRGRRRCGIGGGRGCWSGEGAGKLRGNEDILLTLPSALRNDIRHGDVNKPTPIQNISYLCDTFKTQDMAQHHCCAGCIRWLPCHPAGRLWRGLVYFQTAE